jgi:hypothetical protein
MRVFPRGAGVFNGVVTGSAVGALANLATIACAAATLGSDEPLDPADPPAELELVELGVLQAEIRVMTAASPLTATAVREFRRRLLVGCVSIVLERSVVYKAVTPVVYRARTLCELAYTMV